MHVPSQAHNLSGIFAVGLSQQALLYRVVLVNADHQSAVKR